MTTFVDVFGISMPCVCILDKEPAGCTLVLELVYHLHADLSQDFAMQWHKFQDWYRLQTVSFVCNTEKTGHFYMCPSHHFQALLSMYVTGCMLNGGRPMKRRRKKKLQKRKTKKKLFQTGAYELPLY